MAWHPQLVDETLSVNIASDGTRTIRMHAASRATTERFAAALREVAEELEPEREAANDRREDLA